MDQMSQVHEKIGALTAKVEAAHFRTDKLEILLKEDLAEIKKNVNTLMHERSKRSGWIGAMVLVGVIIGKLIDIVWK